MTTQVSRTRRVLITRSREGNRELVKKLRGSGFEAIAFDTVSFHPPADWSEIDLHLKSLHEFDWLIFTSRIGVRFFISRMRRLLLGTNWVGRPAVAAVGARTRESLEDAGLRVEFTPSEYLTQKLASQLPNDRGRKLLLLRADRADGAMRRRLQRRGFHVEEQRIYRTRFIADGGKTDLSSLDVIVFGSPSEVDGLCNQLTENALDSLTPTPVLCIGPVTARAARARGFKRVTVATTYTFDSLVQELGRVSADA